MSNKMITYGQVQLALSTLGGLTAIAVLTKVDSSRGSGAKIAKWLANVSFEGKTVDEGPFIWGLANGDFTDVEITECIQSDPQEENDVPDSERANRRIWVIGTIDKNAVDSREYPVMKLQNFPFPWRSVEEGDNIQFWVFNADGSAITTGCVVTMRFVAVGEWLLD